MEQPTNHSIASRWWCGKRLKIFVVLHLLLASSFVVHLLQSQAGIQHAHKQSSETSEEPQSAATIDAKPPLSLDIQQADTRSLSTKVATLPPMMTSNLNPQQTNSSYGAGLVVAPSNDSPPKTLINESLATSEDMTNPPLEMKIQTSTATTKVLSRTLVIHVGPHKTGSTFFQSSFCCSPEATTEKLYSLDNLVYLGTCQFYCLTNDKNLIAHNHGVIYRNPKFYQQLEKAKEEGKNAFMVYEDIGGYWYPVQIKTFAERLQEEGWEIQIVFGYRRFFDWIFSMYNQEAKWGLRKGWPDPSAYLTEQSNIPAFEETDAARILQKSHETKEHHFLSHYRMLRDAVGQDHVTILDIHQDFKNTSSSPQSLGDPMLEHFACQLLPNTTHTCAAVRNGVLNLKNAANPSVVLEHDTLAWHAKVKGYYNGEMKRSEVADSIAAALKMLATHPMELPYSCWSQERTDALLSVSLEAERNFFLEVGLPIPSEDKHRAAFQRFVEQKKLCTLNVTAALQDPKWTQFFAELR